MLISLTQRQIQRVNSLTPEERREFLELLELQAQYANENKLRDYRAYAKQAEFHANGKGFRERLLMAGNQLGKCATASTFIDLPDGRRATFGEKYAEGLPFKVTAWDDGPVIRWAVKPIKKQAEPCVRLWFDDGTWFESALKHRVLLSQGRYAFVQDLLPTKPGGGLLVRASDDRRSFQKVANWRSGCLSLLRLCDGQLHLAQVAVEARLRRLADALQCNSLLSCSDASHSKHTSSHQSESDRPSSLDDLARSAGRFFGWLAQGVYRFSQRSSLSIRGLQRTVLESSCGPQSGRAVVGGQSLQSAYDGSGIDGNQIIAYELINSQEVYDFTVPGPANYVSNGIVHHNTWSAGFETSMHLTGRYPDWWKGRTFDKQVAAWAAGVTGEVTRDTAQRVLAGRLNALGTGAIPKDAIKDKSMKRGVADAIDTIVIRHGGGGDVQAGESLLGFKSYDQGREKFQGETLDIVWLDEEPDEDIYTEALTRTNATGGMVYMTFTPLKGMTGTVKRFLMEKPAGSVVTTMTIEDAEHYTPEQRAAIIASYPAHEREARTKGIPTLGSGRIYPIADDVISVKAFPIPEHWAQICGIDFGWDHPSAAVRLAWDRDADILYVTAGHRQKEQTPLLFASTVKPWGDWLPWAWPHDGLQHDKGSGEALRDQYEEQGLAMLEDKATHPPAEGEKEGTGGNGVEAGVLELLDRMQTGRFKVFDHLTEWFEEFRMYHRKDGKIVKLDDDLLSATRYAAMMKRFAITKPTAAKPIVYKTKRIA